MREATAKKYQDDFDGSGSFCANKGVRPSKVEEPFCGGCFRRMVQTKCSPSTAAERGPCAFRFPLAQSEKQIAGCDAVCDINGNVEFRALSFVQDEARWFTLCKLDGSCACQLW